jgi:hypothetical protein
MTATLIILIPAAFIAGAVYGCRTCKRAESQIRALAARLEEMERKKGA